MPQRKIHVGSPLAAKVLRFNARVALVLRRLGRKHDARKKIISNYVSVLFFIQLYVYILLKLPAGNITCAFDLCAKLFQVLTTTGWCLAS